MEPTREQITSVYKQWNATNKVVFIESLYQEMFVVHPEWRALFMFKSYQADPDKADSRWKKQFITTRCAFEKALKLAYDDDMNAFKDLLYHLAQRHVIHNVGQNEFQASKPIFGTVVRKHVQNADVESWKAVVDYICDHISLKMD